MLDMLTLPVAAILGFLAGLGVGGGSLLILWLTLVVGMDYPDARTINLLFFLPSAGIATLFHCKQRSVHLKKIYPAILCGCAAAALCAILGRYLDTGLMPKLFGGLFILTGLRELFYKPKK